MIFAFILVIYIRWRIINDKTHESNDRLILVKFKCERPVGLAISSEGVVYVTECGRSRRLAIY